MVVARNGHVVPDSEKGSLKVRVLAIVKAASPGLIGTTEIGAALGPMVREWMEWGPRGQTMPKQVHHTSHPASSFHHVLRSLERAGCVERHKVARTAGSNPQGQDYWRYVTDVATRVGTAVRTAVHERRALVEERQRLVEELLGGA